MTGEFITTTGPNLEAEFGQTVGVVPPNAVSVSYVTSGQAVIVKRVMAISPEELLDRSGSMESPDAFSIRPALLAGVALLPLFIAAEFYLLSAPIPWYVPMIYVFLLVGFNLVGLLYFLFTRRIRRFVSYAAAFAVLVGSYFGESTLGHEADVAKIYVFRDFYGACAKSALDLGHGAFFNVCESHNLTYTQEAIVYFKSGEPVTEKENIRRWLEVSSHFESQAPFQRASYIESQKLTEEFFKDTFHFE